MKTQNFTFKVKKNQLKKSTNFKLKVKFLKTTNFTLKVKKSNNFESNSEETGRKSKNCEQPAAGEKILATTHFETHKNRVFREFYASKIPKKNSGKSSWNFKSEILKVTFSGGKISL